MAMGKTGLAFLLACAAAAAQAQQAADAGDALREPCKAVPEAPQAAREFAIRAQCVLLGAVPSADRIGEARTLARRAMQMDDPAGGFLLYVAFVNDPANAYAADGRIDMAAYGQLAARGLPQRLDQIEAIEALAFAAGKGHVNAGLWLASYFHETVAPGNVLRLAAMADLLVKGGEKGPLLERLVRESEAVGKAAPGTQASTKVFLQAYQHGVAAAKSGYGVQTSGRQCEQVRLRQVSAGRINDAQFLPLKGTMVANSYLVRGQWTEYWTFQACGEEVPVKMNFRADGWGGSTFTAEHNKG